MSVDWNHTADLTSWSWTGLVTPTMSINTVPSSKFPFSILHLCNSKIQRSVEVPKSKVLLSWVSSSCATSDIWTYIHIKLLKTKNKSGEWDNGSAKEKNHCPQSNRHGILWNFQDSASSNTSAAGVSFSISPFPDRSSHSPCPAQSPNGSRYLFVQSPQIYKCDLNCFNIIQVFLTLHTVHVFLSMADSGTRSLLLLRPRPRSRRM